MTATTWRARAPVEVVLVRPEIAPNVGNVARTCAALDLPLHLVGELPFALSDASLRRAGVDTWAQLELHWHRHLREVIALCGGRALVFTTGGSLALPEVRFAPGDLLVFGRESSGLTAEDLQGCPTQAVRIPQARDVRSLNLATAVGMACGAALSALGAWPDVPAEAPHSPRVA